MGVSLPDGKIIAGGYTQKSDGTKSDFAIARYNADGTIDDSFGNGGKISTDFGENNRYDVINALALQPDGRIVAVGGTSGYYEGIEFAALARYMVA